MMAASDTASRSSSAADSYIGCLISLTSKSEIRYEGVLYNINTDESSIGLRNVRSFGTEGRKKDGPQLLPGEKVYEYILFRGTDIKDLQVKSSPPVQPTAPTSTDPAIIQSQYPRLVTPSTSLPAASGSLTDASPPPPPPTTQLGGQPGSNFQGPLYQPGGNVVSWGASSPAPNANGGGLAMPMYWQGYYGAPNGLPQLHQQSLLRPPPGLSMPSSMQQPMPSSLQQSMQQSMPSSVQQPMHSSVQPPMHSSVQQSMPSSVQQPMHSSMQQPMHSSVQQPMHSSVQQPMHSSMQHFPNFSPSLPTGPSNFPEFPSAFLPVGTSSPNITSTSAPPLNLPTTILPSAPPATLVPETFQVSAPNKAPTVSLPAVTLGANFSSLAPFNNGGSDISAAVPLANKPNVSSGPSLSYQTVPKQTTPSIVGSSNSIRTEPPVPSLVTPAQLLQSGQTVVASSKPSQTAHKDVEVVQVSSASPPEPSVPVTAESQPPILPLPVRPAQRPVGASTQNHHGYGYRGRGRGRGIGGFRPSERFTEDFDFTAMNEKFKKDEVWGHLGKSNKKDGEENASDEDGGQDEDDGDVPNLEVKPVYNKDDFFDSLSCNSLNNDPQNGRIRYSEQIKMDTETFGDFTRNRGGWGGRGPWRGGGGGRGRGGGYYGRGGGGGYGYAGRGRGGRGMSGGRY